jgi:hypothetical protein
MKQVDRLYAKLEDLLSGAAGSGPVCIGPLDGYSTDIRYLVKKPLNRIQANVLKINENSHLAFGTRSSVIHHINSCRRA